jgi:ATP-binding cassette subfamily F protein 3
VIGPNGSGKTTFLRTILGKVPPLSGETRWGAKVQIGYYAQQLEDLDDRNEIIMELRRVAPAAATAGELRSFLARFLFFGDDVYKQVRDLSGGEKGRLSLAKLIYSRVNVLVLDEPTNHLDIPSREALEEALDAYEGTIVTISHDRYFLDRVGTQILALDGEGNADHYNGDYTQYHDWKASRSVPPASATEASKSVPPASAGGFRKSESSASAVSETRPSGRVHLSSNEERHKSVPPGLARRSRRGKKKSVPPALAGGLKRSQHEEPQGISASSSPRIKVIKKPRASEVIEAEISEVESRLAELSKKMAEPEVARDITKLVELNEEYQRTETQLNELLEEWERAETSAKPARR